jgi:N-glycosylase/DNA lyase
MSPPLSVSSALLSGRLCTSFSDLRLDTVLKCGQSFRWTKVGDRWLGAAAGSAFILRQDAEGISFVGLKGGDDADAKAALEDYFQLEVDLKPLYSAWSKADPVFDAVAASFPGVRILRQDPVENVFSFICSSNNNIQR